MAPAAASLSSSSSASAQDVPPPLEGVTQPCNFPPCPRVGTKLCTRCRATFYCSTTCQQADWAGRHRYVCQPTPTVMVNGVTSNSRNTTPSQSMSPHTSASRPNQRTLEYFDLDPFHVDDHAMTGKKRKLCELKPRRKSLTNGSIRANCFLIKCSEGPPTHMTLQAEKDRCIEPYHLASYGTEAAEIAELRRRRGWQSTIGEVAKFYGHEDDDTWYYYVYGQDQTPERRAGLKLNFIAAVLTGQTLYGDVAIVRSGPVGPDAEPYDPEFTKQVLLRTFDWYLKITGPDAKPQHWRIFCEREARRARRKMAFPLADTGFESADMSFLDDSMSTFFCY